MAMTLTVGTNSYVTLAEANAYMEPVINGYNWEEATDDTKNRALATAFREINEQRYNADKLVSTQNGAFPLAYQTSVPNDVKYAQIEWSNELLGIDYVLEQQLAQGLKSKSIDSVSESYQSKISTSDMNPIPRRALRYLSKYLGGGTAQIR